MDASLNGQRSRLVQETARWMDAGEAPRALAALTRLEQELRRHDRRVVDLPGIMEAFRLLLHRRGYRVGADAEFRDALEEIRQTGPGFDLYNLAEGLARYDTTARECMNAVDYPLFPSLLIFARPCGCGGHERKPS